MTCTRACILLTIFLISGACMPTPAQPQSSPQHPAGYTGMDDVLIPTPAVPVTIKSETFPFDALSRNPSARESSTMVYITSKSFDAPTSTLSLADQWITGHSGPKTKFQLLSRTAVDSPTVPPVLDEKGNMFSPPYMLTFESMGAEDYPGTQRPLDDNQFRQMFYFLPVSAQHIVTARVLREVKYFEGFPQFEAQYEHFHDTLKRDTATPQSTLKGSKPLTRRFYTAYFSFEIFLPEKPGGGNQWLMNKSSSNRSDLWHTPEGDIAVSYEIISGFDFDVARENQKLKMDAKGLVKNLKGVVKGMNPDAYVPELRYIETKFAGQEIYGHREDRESRVVIKLDTAYKTGKQITIGIGGSPAAINAHEKDILAWLAQFKILQ